MEDIIISSDNLLLLLFTVFVIMAVLGWIAYDYYKTSMYRTPIDARKDLNNLFKRFGWRYGRHFPIAEEYGVLDDVVYKEICDYLTAMKTYLDLYMKKNTE